MAITMDYRPANAIAVKACVEHSGNQDSYDVEFGAHCFATECPFCHVGITTKIIHFCGEPIMAVLHPSVLGDGQRDSIRNFIPGINITCLAW